MGLAQHLPPAYGYPQQTTLMYAPAQYPQSQVIMINPAGFDFATHLFDCFKDFPSCLDALCCPYCTLGSQYDMIHTGRKNMNPGVCAGTFCLDACFAGGFAAVLMTTFLRTLVRERYNIRGDQCTDFMSAFCCHPCVLSQVTREMTLHGQWPGGICASQPPQIAGYYGITQ